MKKRILLVTGSYYGQVKGGAEYQQYLIGGKFKEEGYKLYYLFIDNGQKIKYQDHFCLVRIPKRFFLRRLIRKYFVFDFFKIIRELKKIKPDIILMRTGFAYLGILAKYTQSHNCKLIWNVALRKDVEPFKFTFTKSIIFDFIDKKVLEYGIKRATHIICQAKYQDDLLFKYYRRRSDLIIPNFHPAPKGEITKTFPLKIVWVANFKSFKQPDLFLELASRHRNDKSVQFIMIGRFSDSNLNISLFSEMQKVSNYIFMGELPNEEVNLILNKAHIFVNTSLYEGFPNTFIQAWMRKVPVVSLNVDPDDLLKQRKIGFHSKTLDQMLKDVQTLIDSPQIREEMGKRAREFALNAFSLQNIDKIVGLMEESQDSGAA